MEFIVLCLLLITIETQRPISWWQDLSMPPVKEFAMTKNAIQFRQELWLSTFSEHFGTKEQYRQALFRIDEPNIFRAIDADTAVAASSKPTLIEK